MQKVKNKEVEVASNTVNRFRILILIIGDGAEPRDRGSSRFSSDRLGAADLEPRAIVNERDCSERSQRFSARSVHETK
jgi:hypothetical protein